MKLTPMLVAALFAAILTPAANTGQNAPQKPPSPASPPLEERVKKLEAELSEQKQKLAATELEKNYVERVETDTKAYYEKAFNAQIIILSILGLIIGLVGKFGVDHIVEAKLTSASTKLTDDFTTRLAAKLQTLEELNAAQMKRLEQAFMDRLANVASDLSDQSDYDNSFAAGLAFAGVNQFQDAVQRFTRALQAYKRGKPRGLFPTEGLGTIGNILQAIRRLNPDKTEEALIKELRDPLYNGLEAELNELALQRADYAPVIRKARLEPPAAPS